MQIVCETGYRLVVSACVQIVCPTGQELVGSTCVPVPPPPTVPPVVCGAGQHRHTDGTGHGRCQTAHSLRCISGLDTTRQRWWSPGHAGDAADGHARVQLNGCSVRNRTCDSYGGKGALSDYLGGGFSTGRASSAIPGDRVEAKWFPTIDGPSTVRAARRGSDSTPVNWRPRLPSASPKWPTVPTRNWVFISNAEGIGFGSAARPRGFNDIPPPVSPALAARGFRAVQCGSASAELVSVRWGFNGLAAGDQIHRLARSGPFLPGHVISGDPIPDPANRVCNALSGQLIATDGRTCDGAFRISTLPAGEGECSWTSPAVNRKITAWVVAVWEVDYYPHRHTGQNNSTVRVTLRSATKTINVNSGCRLPVG